MRTKDGACGWTSAEVGKGERGGRGWTCADVILSEGGRAKAWPLAGEEAGCISAIYGCAG